ncbi:MAG TPA: hypothetical protein VIH90_03055 [Candidatus Saccharimonadales bacterium]
MSIVILLILIAIIVSIIKFRSDGILPFIPMLLSIIFIVALTINIQNSITYLDNHPELSGKQVGWFPGYWPIPFLGALLIIIGAPIYLQFRYQKIRAHTSKLHETK